MKRFVIGTIKHTVKAVAYGLIGGLIGLVAVFVWYLESRPDLKIWHEAELDAEFTTSSPARTFADYLALESRLFEQLDRRVYDKIEAADRRLINRYHRGSLSDPERWSPEWNRSFELKAAEPRAGVLLLHGMSDSPYSLHSLGQRLNGAGASVVGLRLPGHGTAPSGLVSARWQDMAAAVRLAMGHLRDVVGDKPLYIVGYSNGGALAVHYALSALEDGTLPAPSGLVLISPAIGVARVAALAVWQARLGHLLGLDKLSWSSIIPEYDPFKYGSFAVNAGDQVYRLTAEIQSRLQASGAAGALQRFPPLLAFQSAVDATVSTPALVSGLLERLPPGGHELVLFDINRRSEVEALLEEDPGPDIRVLLQRPDLPFTLSLLTNENEHSRRVAVRRKTPGAAEISEIQTGLAWPAGVYSLSHVALPFPGSDPLYGGENPGESPGIRLGNLAPRGERGVLQIPAADMLRLRWNPFYSYLEGRVLDFFHLASPSAAQAPAARPAIPDADGVRLRRRQLQ